MELHIETIDDIISHLEILLTATKELKTRTRYKEAAIRSADPLLQKQRQEINNEQVLAAYSIYKQLRTSGIKHTQAIAAIRKAHEVNYDTAEIMVIQGRKHFKRLRANEIRRESAENRLSISEQAKKHKIAYNTVKKILLSGKDNRHTYKAEDNLSE